MENEKKKKGLAELVFILDKSGSMSGLEADTAGGFNSLIEKQKRVEGSAFVTTVLFDTETRLLHDREDLASVSLMTKDDCAAGGGTALLDAVGETIERIALIHKHARDEDRPDSTVFVITTDGEENSSRRFSLERVREMVTERKERDGWEFIFLGANIDAFAAAGKLGISRDRAANFLNDAKGIATNFDTLGCFLGDFRTFGAVSSDWAGAINEDVAERGDNPFSGKKRKK